MPDGYEVTAEVMYKDGNGIYSSMGLRPEITLNADLNIAFDGLNMKQGSYCLMISIRDTSSALVISRVPYYFVLYGWVS